MNTFGALAQPATPATGPAPNTAVPTAAPDNVPASANGEPMPSVPKQPDSPSPPPPPQKSDAPAPKPEQSQGATPNASPDAPQPEQSGGASPNASPNAPSPSDHQQDPNPPAPSPTENPQDHPQDPRPPASSPSGSQPKVVQANPQAISLSRLSHNQALSRLSTKIILQSSPQVAQLSQSAARS